MAKNAITDYSSTAASNTDVGGVDIQGSAAASNMDDSQREIMSHLADTNAGNAPWADTMTIGDAADLTKEMRFELSGITAGQTRVYTVPDYDGTIATLAGTETFTNKTLTAATLGGTTNLAGGQIAFPAAQSASGGANTLDDYEEGSSTPTLTPGAGTITTSSASLAYTKIGNRVFFSVQVTITDAGTGSGALGVSLPFTSTSLISANGANATSGVAVAGVGASATASMSVLLYDGSTAITSGNTYYINGQFSV